MENLEMIKVAENGQMFIDFNALELITSAEFVLEIKDDLEIYESIERAIDNIEIEILENSVSVFVKIATRITVYTYYKNSNRFERMSLSKLDLERMCKMFGKEVDFYG
ncbi:hypothetical protein [Schinkia azotoformans]|uniref:hypothetical protein n=1 Tax=Schinkia azotoformans TaxID=1454 RepID=UPI003D2AA044